MPLHVGLVGYHGYPSEAVGARRLSELALHLQRGGHRCTQFSATATDVGDSRLMEAGVNHIRIIDSNIDPSFVHTDSRWLDPAPRKALRQRLWQSRILRWLYRRAISLLHVYDAKKMWSFRLLRDLNAAHTKHPFDVVLVSGPPFSPTLACSIFGATRQVPVIVDLRDPWPALAVRSTGTPSMLTNAGMSWATSQAAFITVTTLALAEALKVEFGVDALVIPNGFDDWMVRHDDPERGCLKILHAGTVYLNRSPKSLIEGIAIFLRRNPAAAGMVQLRFVGHCDPDRRREIAEAATRLGITDAITIAGRVSPDDVPRLISRSNVLVTLAQGQPGQIPAKLYEQAASRRPILVISEPDSSTAMAVANFPRAVVADDDPWKIADAIALLYTWLCTADDQLPALTEADLLPFSRHQSIEQFERLFAAAGTCQPG
jgi:glycosyltransferase involved in cell wall biosynthesis